MAPLDKWKCLISLTSNIKDVNVSAASPISVICKPYNFPFLDVRRDYACRAMFGNDSSWWLHKTYHSFRGDVHRDIPMFEQVIPVGSVGYINPFTRKFVVLFNGIDPTSSTDQRIKSIPSLLESGVTKLIFDPKISSFPDWGREYTLSDISDVGALFGAWIDGRTVHSVPFDCDRSEWLCLAVGQVFARELVGSHFDSWLLEHKETILDVFGDDHPFVRRRLDLVTTTIDTAQYAWFSFYPKTGRYSQDQYFYFLVNPRASLTPGSLWGNFVKKDGFSDNMITWSHISTVGQSPMTVEICCHSFEQTDGVWYAVFRF
ncbi:hypothetical protein EV421DRAFT_633509 [Armillaria borealis]|uniref:Uncharacterized protein n=1 Tax=Armillaria borealis TaxID=47425 RepID=A0AA39JFG2_9AGAR|nr:hypothetical protein EV421DRAFT_633509 [Armillaria borealis]